MSDFKTSLLVNNQLPEFIKNEYPKFISFLEAYYEFLETKQGSQNNDLISQAKKLRYNLDIDSSLDEFETRFYEKFATLLPKDTVVRKDILFKNLTNLYLSKGNSESYKLLFRLLFGEEVEIIEPKNEVLKASASTWSIESALRAEPETLNTYYVANADQNSFPLAGCRCPITKRPLPIQIRTVTINDIEVTNYVVYRESAKIIFDTPLNLNDVVRVYYDNFDFSLLSNRKVTGKSSGAYGIIERSAVSVISNRNVQDLYINSKTLIGQFTNGERCESTIIDSKNNLINIEFLTSSSLRAINIIDGGSNYSNGDVVVISGGSAEQEAVAIIEEVFSGFIDQINVNKPGAGFQETGAVIGIDPPLIVNGSIATINTNGANIVTSYTVLSDLLISNLSSLQINSGDYSIPGKTIDSASRIMDIYEPRTLSVGAIDSCIVISSNVATRTIPIVDAEGASYFTGTSRHTITCFGSLGGYSVVDKGTGYRVGDEVIFGPNPVDCYGTGAAARVINVDGSGGIINIAFEPARITGTANVGTNSHIVIGTNTLFDSEIVVGDTIMVNGQSRIVNAITSSTELNCTSVFTHTSNNKNVGLHNLYPLGGVNYAQNNFPIISVSSEEGVGANIVLDSVMGDGENLTARGSRLPGAIVKIKIVDSGKGYKYIPFVSLEQSGDGLAIANASIESSFVTFDGKWTSSDSIISSTERKIQGKDYYVDYSYVTSSKVEFRKYKKILKELLHPSGLVNYARLKLQKEINVDDMEVITIPTTSTLSGKVNIGEGSIYLTGSGTLFNVANDRGIMTANSIIDVNGRIYVVNTFISNTNVEVRQIESGIGYTVSSVPFDVTQNLQTIIVLTTE